MTWQDIDGWFDFHDLYAEAVAAAPWNAIFVEVGCWLGRSTAFLAQKIKESRKAITLFAVDTWGGSKGSDRTSFAAVLEKTQGNVFPLFVANMLACEVSNFITPLKLPSIDAAEIFAARSIDFCFLDADHDYHSVLEDIHAWHQKVKPTGVLAGHDINMPGVIRAVEEIFGKDGFTIREPSPQEPVSISPSWIRKNRPV